MNRVFCIGDIHGSFKPVRDFSTYMKSSFKKDNHLDISDTLIVLGDFGGNFFFNHRDEEFKRKLGTYNVTYFIIRGNHEERPSLCFDKGNWHTETYFEGLVYVEDEFPYIKYAADVPSVYNILGHSTLVIPGAYSVDKYHRLQNGWSWFENEQLSQEEMDLGRDIVAQNSNWDIVLSHTCPVCYEPTDLFLSVVDQSMVDKTMERYLGEIEYQINYKLWLWGHYHATRVYPKFDDSDRIMLFNTEVLDLKKYFESNDACSSLIKIY